MSLSSNYRTKDTIPLQKWKNWQKCKKETGLSKLQLIWFYFIKYAHIYLNVYLISCKNISKFFKMHLFYILILSHNLTTCRKNELKGNLLWQNCPLNLLFPLYFRIVKPQTFVRVFNGFLCVLTNESRLYS